MNRQKAEEAFKYFVSAHQDIAARGPALSLFALADKIKNGIDILADAFAANEEAIAVSVPTEMNVRAQVWLKILSTALLADGGPDETALGCAEQALEDFDERFPEYKSDAHVPSVSSSG